MYSFLMGASMKDSKQGRSDRHLSLSAGPFGFVAFVASTLALAAGASTEGVPLHLVTVLLPTDLACAESLFQLCTCNATFQVASGHCLQEILDCLTAVCSSRNLFCLTPYVAAEEKWSQLSRASGVAVAAGGPACFYRAASCAAGRACSRCARSCTAGTSLAMHTTEVKLGSDSLRF